MAGCGYLVVELDGGYHDEPEQHEEDIVRQENLERMGYTVIRFSNEEVLCNTNKVIAEVKSYLKGFDE